MLNNDDLEPLCPTNDTDYCGVCAGGGEDDLGCGCFNPAALEYWYDSDGDGVANYYDSFPNNPNMDSYTDLILRIVVVAFVIGLALSVVQATRGNQHDAKSPSSVSDEIRLSEAENQNQDRPIGPPPPNSFQ